MPEQPDIRIRAMIADLDQYSRISGRAVATVMTALADEQGTLNRRLDALEQRAPGAGASYQQRVQPWLLACFGAEIAADTVERNHRFLEESLELVQTNGCTQSEAHQLVDYVFGRPVGDIGQEIGGVMNTLAALCLSIGRDMHQDGETELARVWTKVEQIRAKQAAKPKHSPLPVAQPQPAGSVVERTAKIIRAAIRDNGPCYTDADIAQALASANLLADPAALTAAEAHDCANGKAGVGIDPDTGKTITWREDRDRNRKLFIQQKRAREAAEARVKELEAQCETARRDALEEAAGWHDGQAANARIRHEELSRGADDVEERRGWRSWKDREDMHRYNAACVRALAAKEPSNDAA